MHCSPLDVDQITQNPSGYREGLKAKLGGLVNQTASELESNFFHSKTDWGHASESK